MEIVKNRIHFDQSFKPAADVFLRKGLPICCQAFPGAFSLLSE